MTTRSRTGSAATEGVKMTRSSLCTYTNITGNHSAGRAGNRICKITPHYMAARWSGRQCADYFASTDKEVSATYCIGTDGDIAMSVDEADRPWTSASAWNDNQAITIECANIDNGSGEMTQATWNALVALCTDICRRYGFRLEYTGNASGSLTEHRMFASTACPGAWLHGRMGQLASEVNAQLDGSGSAHGTPAPSSSFLAKVTVDALNIRQGPGTNYALAGCIRDRGTYTIVETSGNWGRLKSGAGWICLDYTNRNGYAIPAPASVDIDALARDVIAGKYGNGEDRKRSLGANYAAVQRRVNEMLS